MADPGDFVGWAPPSRRWPGRVNLRVAAVLLALAVGVVGAEAALRQDSPFVYSPDPVLGHYLRPAPEHLAGTPWTSNEDVDLRVLVLGGVGQAVTPGDDGATLAALVQQLVQARFPGRKVAVGLSLQRNYDLPRLVLLAEELLPRYRPDVVVVYLYRWTAQDYRPVPPERAADFNFRRALYRSEIAHRLLFALYPNTRSHDFDEWPSEVLDFDPLKDGPDGLACPEAVRRLAELTGRPERPAPVVLLSRSGVDTQLAEYQRSLDEAGLPWALVEDRPWAMGDDLWRPLARKLAEALPEP